MDKTVSKIRWRAIYRLLDMVQPVDYDCGALCGAACCTCPGENLGIFLMPGEEEVIREACADHPDWLRWKEYDPQTFGYPETWPGKLYYIDCRTAPKCPRTYRPLQCRSFPVKPYINERGLLELIWDYDDVPYKCPLIETNAEISEDFFKATYTVWSHLLRCEAIYDLVLLDSEIMREKNE